MDNKDLVLLDPEFDAVPHVPVEHNPLVMVEPAIPMTVLESDICELHSMAKSTKYIADHLGCKS